MMKKSFSLPEKLRRKPVLWWILAHLCLFLPVLLTGPINLETSFFSILPTVRNEPALIEVNEILQTGISSRIQVLSSSQDFDIARNAAEAFSAKLSDAPGLISVDWETTSSSLTEIRDFIFDFRHNLLNREDRELLERGLGSELAMDALMEVYSPASFARLDSLDTDPFLLTDRILLNYLDAAGDLGSNLSPRDGVMWAEFQGRHYILLSIEIDASFDSETVISHLEETAETIVQEYADVGISLTGFPLHNAESSSNAKKEITVISSISLTVLLFILLLVFRSPVPFLASILMIAIAATASFIQTHFFFGHIHVLALVFGTSLIGITIDYSLHFYVGWMKRRNGSNLRNLINEILPSIGMGMVTTVISYLALSLTPIPLLRQIAVFSIIGIFSSFLTVVLLFPAFGGKTSTDRARLVKKLNTFLAVLSHRGKTSSRLISTVLTLVILLVSLGAVRLNLNNDVGSFYSMSDELAQKEKLFSEVVGTASMSRYFVVLGEDEEDLLARESALADSLEILQAKEQIGSWLGITRFVPSIAEQEESQRLTGEFLAPLAPGQYATLGLKESEVPDWTPSFFERKVLSASDLVEADLLPGLENLWIGNAGEVLASLVFVYGCEDESFLAELSGENVHWVDSVSDISVELQDMSVMALALVLAAYALILVILIFLRGWKASIRISAVPVIAAAMGCGMIGWTNSPFNLFAVFGLVLSLGIGIDYAIFLYERREEAGDAFLAVALSCFSTLLSFGALALSTFAPVSDFGRIVLWAVLFSFIVSPLAIPRKGKKNSGEKDDEQE